METLAAPAGGGALGAIQGADLYLDSLRVAAWVRRELRASAGAVVEAAAAEGGGGGGGEAQRAVPPTRRSVAAPTRSKGRRRRCATALAAEVGAACAARLAPVKTIGAAFRVSGKALPTAPGFFVAEILGPL